MFDALFSDVKPPASPSSSTGGTTRVAVDDPSHALELVLPYLYSARIEPIELTFPELWEAVKIMDKYEVLLSRGRARCQRSSRLGDGLDSPWS